MADLRPRPLSGERRIPDAEVYSRSIASLTAATQRSARIGAQGVVVHAGSALDGDLTDARLRAASAILHAVAAGEEAALGGAPPRSSSSSQPAAVRAPWPAASTRRQ
ncbi:MAG: hypothetical protein M5T61_11415 [Acidimicrobiia bacterium]|nr:hypothetical protein [Acidimicrobiia bacterium]